MLSMVEGTPGDQPGTNSAQHRPGVIWVTGYSASGKTTVARKLEFKLRQAGLRSVYLDGDDLRAIFGNHWGYAREQRIELTRIYFRLCSHLAAQGLTVVIAAIAMYDETRAWLKTNVPNAIEVFLDVPESERRQRDAQTKGIYARNQDLSTLYDAPSAPDMTIANHGETTPEQAAEQILTHYLSAGARRDADHGKRAYWEQYYATAAAPDEPSSFACVVAPRLTPACRLLEVGCGNGRDAAYFARQGHAVTAIDPAAAAIAASRVRYAHLQVRFMQGQIAELATELEGAFAVIYSRFVLHAMTLDEEGVFIAQARHWLQPNGRLYLECRSINDPLARKGDIISPTERLAGHYRRFIILDELCERLLQHGFRIEEAVEAKGLAQLGDDDPVVIRITASV
ncbi:adenylyl-sulfate kinase [Lamprobacter modestohalophilus]|uniref:adenylyl-sulfate kinase n=1 Tax=Lamprobacter modestohalophilus TaxID=1064514 RepID=UPI002ADEA8A8|nr:adenylyl-sulfate kinase [Lamprobacter modestohalophilus]MEA1053004.1 adenylyl-sulfate kinase [Lamprobacter modestohalophilus]